MEYIATLTIGSALGSSILGVLFALVYMKKNNIYKRLKINVNYASAPSSYFFINLKPSSSFEIINTPVQMMTTGDNHLYLGTIGNNLKELYYTPGVSGYQLFHETDYDILQDVFNTFWKEQGLFKPDVHTKENLVCLHIRRGDKLVYEKSLKVNSIEEYSRTIEELSLTKNTILILTDQYDTYTDFKAARPEWDVQTSASDSNVGFNISSINTQSSEIVQKEVERMLDDFNLIFNSSYFIGTRSSSVSYIGRLLKNNKNFVLLD